MFVVDYLTFSPALPNTRTGFPSTTGSNPDCIILKNNSCDLSIHLAVLALIGYKKARKPTKFERELALATAQTPAVPEVTLRIVLPSITLYPDSDPDPITQQYYQY